MNEYLKMRIQTATPLQLVIMLYDGAIKFMKAAVKEMEKGNIEKQHNYLVRAQDIISELLISLNEEEGGDIAKNLKMLYLYMKNRLIEANIQNNIEYVKEVINLMSSLKEAWVELERREKQGALSSKEVAKHSQSSSQPQTVPASSTQITV